MFTYILCKVILITSPFSIDFLFTDHFVLQCIEFSVSPCCFIFLVSFWIERVLSTSFLLHTLCHCNKPRLCLCTRIQSNEVCIVSGGEWHFLFFFHTALNWDLWRTLKKKPTSTQHRETEKKNKKQKRVGNCVGKNSKCGWRPGTKTICG